VRNLITVRKARQCYIAVEPGEIVCEKQIRAISASNCLRPLVFTPARMMRRSEWIPAGFSAAELKQSNWAQSVLPEARSSMDDRFVSTPEITMSRYADF
jgi:hypothetical protein